MATYTQLSRGSRGDDVKKMQQALVDKGYDIGSAGVDGSYGPATRNAVIKYQQDNGLKVDGVAGDQTLGSLYGTNSTTANTGNTGTANQTTQQTQTTPQYQATYDQQLNDLYQQIVNRDKFSYDINEDALYQQYADQYVTQGKLAMQDTMGQAAAMTGGYGNSYAESVGQQAYQGYLQQLNDKVPELYGMAYDQYAQEGQDLLNQYAMLGEMRDTEYQRYQDELDQYWNNKSFEYQQERDKVADEQWQKQYDESVRQYNKSYALSASKSSGGSKGSGSGGSKGSGSGGAGGATGDEATGGYAADTSGVSSNIHDRASGYTNNNDLANYLDGLVASGAITEGQADAMYAEYKQPDIVGLSDRSWTLVDDGGVNWFWGIDNNATVRDQYGNTYRLDKLIDALVAEGMSKSDAKAYVKNLQKKLGA